MAGLIVKQNSVGKEHIKFCTERSSIGDALALLQETGFIALPVLDAAETKYLGAVYKVDIYELLHREPEALKEPVMTLVTHRDAFVYEDSSFYKVLFTLRRLPYVAILNESNDFVGILTHTKIMEFLEDSLGVKTHGYMLTVVTNEYKGALTGLLNIIREHCSIESLVTLDSGDKYLRRIALTLPKELTDDKLAIIQNELEHKGYRVTHCEKIGA